MSPVDVPVVSSVVPVVLGPVVSGPVVVVGPLDPVIGSVVETVVGSVVETVVGSVVGVVSELELLPVAEIDPELEVTEALDDADDDDDDPSLAVAVALAIVVAGSPEHAATRNTRPRGELRRCVWDINRTPERATRAFTRWRTLPVKSLPC